MGRPTTGQVVPLNAAAGEAARLVGIANKVHEHIDAQIAKVLEASPTKQQGLTRLQKGLELVDAAPRVYEFILARLDELPPLQLRKIDARERLQALLWQTVGLQREIQRVIDGTAATAVSGDGASLGHDAASLSDKGEASARSNPTNTARSLTARSANLNSARSPSASARSNTAHSNAASARSGRSHCTTGTRASRTTSHRSSTSTSNAREVVVLLRDLGLDDSVLAGLERFLPTGGSTGGSTGGGRSQWGRSAGSSRSASSGASESDYGGSQHCLWLRRMADATGGAWARLEARLAPFAPPMLGARYLLPIYVLVSVFVPTGMAVSSFALQLDNTETALWMICVEHAFWFDVLLTQPLVQLLRFLLQRRRQVG